MNQSFQNKNNGNETWEIYVDDVIMVEMEKGLKIIPMSKLKQVGIQKVKRR
jgi:hypothetical protein